MMPSASPKQRVLIVGAKFGEMYLNAFMQPPEGLELVGLLAQGSARSRELAHAFGIPLYTSPEQITRMPDIACIVVRSTVAGGTGTQLARHFLTRGVHVIQEHPLHPDDISSLQTLAQEQGCCYWVNTFYPHTRAGRTWLRDAQQLRRCLAKTPPVVHATTSRQLLYSTLDLLLLALGVDAAAVECDVVGSFSDFHCLRLFWPEGEACLLLQRYLDPDDPDMHSLIIQPVCRRPSGERPQPLPQTGDPARSAGSDAQRGAPELARLLRNRRAGGRQLVATPVAQPSGGRTSTSGLPKRTSDRVITFMAADFT